MKKIEERRKHKRFKIQNRVYVTLKDEGYKFGQIINISKGGFAFLCVVNEKQLNGFFKVDLFSETNTHILRDMPIKTISAFNYDNEPSFTHGKMKRYGCQFVELTQTQQNQLHYFIEKHTTK